jgi:hypothetical protein
MSGPAEYYNAKGTHPFTRSDLQIQNHHRCVYYCEASFKLTTILCAATVQQTPWTNAFCFTIMETQCPQMANNNYTECYIINPLPANVENMVSS